MKEFGGLWFPDGETHLIEWMQQVNRIVDGKQSYQYHKLEAALKYCKNFRNAVDVGAHIGLWSMHLVKRFNVVYAFEPVAAHRACFECNVDGVYTLFKVALGETSGMVSIHTAPTSSGDSWVVEGQGDIAMWRLDSLELSNIDFMKLDCEGYELFALKGAEDTLKRCHPCVIVEQKPGRAQKFGLKETEAVSYLQDLGATFREVLSGDYILSW